MKLIWFASIVCIQSFARPLPQNGNNNNNNVGQLAVPNGDNAIGQLPKGLPNVSDDIAQASELLGVIVDRNSNNVAAVQNGDTSNSLVQTAAIQQGGEESIQITAQSGQNAVTAMRNFLGDVQLVSNAINMLGSGDAKDPDTMRRLAQLAFNAEINEDEQRAIMLQSAGQAGNEANDNILTFTPTVLNGLQAIVDNPTPENAKALANLMGTVRNARILPSIGNLATAAIGGSMPVNTIIQATTQQSNVNNAQSRNSATLQLSSNNNPNNNNGNRVGNNNGGNNRNNGNNNNGNGNNNNGNGNNNLNADQGQGDAN